MSNPIEIIEPGSKVIVGDNIEAVVVSVTVTSRNCILYTVAWWSGGSRNESNIRDFEIRSKRKKIALGFKEGVRDG